MLLSTFSRISPGNTTLAANHSGKTSRARASISAASAQSGTGKPSSMRNTHCSSGRVKSLFAGVISNATAFAPRAPSICSPCSSAIMRWLSISSGLVTGFCCQ
jgi:hypothetical protein